jgi:hypothetical protein
MTRTLRGLPAWSLTMTAFLSGITAPLGSAAQGQEIPFDEADVFAELNDTDGDLGFHALIDGEAWDRLVLRAPNGRTILRVRPSRSLGQQGLTEIFFESDEPGFDELAPEEFFERFPEGDYEVSGRTLEGDELESTARFSHRLPAPPGGIEVSGIAIDPELVDCEGPLTLVPTPVTISWDPVTRSHPELGRTDQRIRVASYQLVVEREEPELLVYSVDLPPSVTELEVPAGFIELGEEFKLEIVVRARNGNQTAVESCFAVE